MTDPAVPPRPPLPSDPAWAQGYGSEPPAEGDGARIDDAPTDAYPSAPYPVEAPTEAYPSMTYPVDAPTEAYPATAHPAEAPTEAYPSTAHPADAQQTWAYPAPAYSAPPLGEPSSAGRYRMPEYGAAPTWASAPAPTALPYPGAAAPGSAAEGGWPYSSQTAGYPASASPPAPASAPYGAPAFAAPYSAPAAAGWRPPNARPSRALGVIALVLACVAAVGAPIVGGITAWIIGQSVGSQVDTAVPTRGVTDLSILSPVRDVVLIGEIAFWTGTVLGAWAIGQGIVAIAKRRGRGFGIAALIVAVLGFGVFVVVAWFAFLLGLSTGAATGTVS